MKNNRKIARDRQAIKEIARAYWREAYSEPSITDVVGIADMERHSGYARRSLWVYSTREDFPAPIARNGQKLLWRRADFMAWLKRKGKRKS
jgi:predicted DNA-binding transcriptional regulator AlpA